MADKIVISQTQKAVSEIDYGVVINELSLQVANYARDNAILKSVIKSLQDQLAAQSNPQP